MAYYPPPQASPAWPGWPTQGTPPDYPSPPPDTPFQPDLQLDSSIGPSRVLTRRQRAALDMSLARRVQTQPYDASVQRQPSTTLFMNSVSRPQTPPPNEFHRPRESLSLNLPAGAVVQPSPTYHPLTPSSTSTSPFSTFGFYSARHSRSNSLSNTTNPRSASPALSTTSALTSISSCGSAPTSLVLPGPGPDSPVNGKPKKQRLYNVDRKNICVYARENPNARQEDIARQYGVERSTISKILKNKTKWLNVPADENLRIAKHRPSKFPEIEEEMVKWLLECRDTNTVLSDSMIRNKAKEIARELGIGEVRFKASSGWIENFKHRHGVRAGVWTGDGKNVRAARALGLVPPLENDAPLLSPLNPAFNDSQTNDMMIDRPPVLTSQTGEILRAPHIDVATDQPSWLSNQSAEPPQSVRLPTPPDAPPPSATRQPLSDPGPHQAPYSAGATEQAPSWLHNHTADPPALPASHSAPPPPADPAVPHQAAYSGGTPEQPTWMHNHSADPPELSPPHSGPPPPTDPIHQAPYSAGTTEQPSWLMNHSADSPALSAPHPHASQSPTQHHLPSDPNPHQAAYSTNATEQAPSWMHNHSADPPPQQPPPVYDHVVYEMPSRPTPEATSLAQAEVAFNTVLNFFDTQGQGILQPNERNMLSTIKCALFQAAGGLPYDRSRIPYEQGESGTR